MSNRLVFLNLLSYFSLVIANFLAIQLPFFGKTPGDVSKLIPTLFTPADFAFSIWSLIYLMLGIFSVYQARRLFRKDLKLDQEIPAISYLFFATCLCNIGWLLTWQSMHISWSFVSIFILWILLMVIYYRLAMLAQKHWIYTIPFSFYFAWVCVAALANLNVLLTFHGFDFFGLSEESWTTALIILGVFGTLLILYLNQDPWFTLVLIWAFFGIYMKNIAQTVEGNAITNTSLIAILILSTGGIWAGIKRWKAKLTN